MHQVSELSRHQGQREVGRGRRGRVPRQGHVLVRSADCSVASSEVGVLLSGVPSVFGLSGIAAHEEHVQLDHDLQAGFGRRLAVRIGEEGEFGWFLSEYPEQFLI